MTIIGKLLEEFKKIEQRLEISKKCGIIESEDDEEIEIPEQEYAIVMSTLNTWLLTSKQYGRKKYIKKEINVPIIKDKEEVYIYTFKKITGNHYIIINKVLVDEENR